MSRTRASASGSSVRFGLSSSGVYRTGPSVGEDEADRHRAAAGRRARSSPSTARRCGIEEPALGIGQGHGAIMAARAPSRVVAEPPPVHSGGCPDGGGSCSVRSPSPPSSSVRPGRAAGRFGRRRRVRRPRSASSAAPSATPDRRRPEPTATATPTPTRAPAPPRRPPPAATPAAARQRTAPPRLRRVPPPRQRRPRDGREPQRAP